MKSSMKKNYSIYHEKPSDFSEPIREGACCVCEYENTILMLKRHSTKWEGNTWNVPGGKVERNETPLLAAIRETYEEAGIVVVEECIDHLGPLYVRSGDGEHCLHIFRAKLLNQPKIVLQEEESTEYLWKTLQEAFDLPLIAGGIEVLEMYQNFKNSRS